MKELKVLRNKVVEAIERHPEAKAILETLFPEVKSDPRDKEIFAYIGQILIRRNNTLSEENTYTLMVSNGQVILYNIRHNHVWQTNGVVSEHRLIHNETGMTRGLFKELLAGKGAYIEEFTPIPPKYLYSFNPEM